MAFTPKNILVIRLSGMGNAIFALSVIQALKERFPESRVTFLTHHAYLPIVKMSETDEGVGLFRISSSRGTFNPFTFLQSFQDAFQKLRRTPFDLLIDLQSFFETTLLSRLLWARLRLGLVRHRWQSFFFDRFLFSRPRQPGEHQIGEFGRVLDLLELPFSSPFPRLKAPSSIVEGLQDTLGFSKNRPWVGVNLGASHPSKRYPLSQLHPLFTYLEQHGCPTFLFWGPLEGEVTDQIRGFLQRYPHIHPLPPSDLEIFASYLSLLDIFISPDTGPLHLASALGTSVIGLFREGYAHRYGPLVRPCRVLENKEIQTLPVNDIIGALENLSQIKKFNI